MCALTLLVFVGICLKMVLLVKKLVICVQIQSFTALSKKFIYLFHQMILLTIVKKLFNSNHIHAFYIFSSWNFIAHLSSEKSSSKPISNRNFSKPPLTLFGDFMCICFYVLCCTVQTQQGITKNNDLAQVCTAWSTYSHTEASYAVVHEIQSWFNNNNMAHIGQVQFVMLCTE